MTSFIIEIQLFLMNRCVRRIVFALAGWLFLTTGTLSAQVGFSLPFFNNATPGTIINVPLKVTGFNNIASVQFVLSWDPQTVGFFSVDNFNLPGLDAAEFNSMQALSEGILRFAWVSSNLQIGTTVPNETLIFRLRLQVIGPINAGSAVTITQSPPTSFEVNQINNGVLQSLDMSQVQLTNGFVAVGYTVGTTELSDHSEWPVSIVPNPFSETTQIFFENEEGADIQMFITDVAGQIIVEKNIISPVSSQHGMEIASSQLREKGMYFLILRTDKRSCVRPLFLF